jgi:hypothetical protein
LQRSVLYELIPILYNHLIQAHQVADLYRYAV